MKQILQDLGSGKITVADVATPSVRPGHIVIATSHTLISAGTERMLLEFGRAGYLDKARKQPEKLREVLAKIRTDGLLETLAVVRSRLGQALPLGYCNVGTVVEIGEGVTDMEPGDVVASNAYHAEFVCVPRHLLAKVPKDVSPDQAAFTVVGAIALQGVRLLRAELGESICVMGLGLVGLLAVQVLRAGGARVIGMDFDSARVRIAEDLGVPAVDLSTGTDPVEAAMAFSRRQGVDGVLITASTASDDLVSQAANMCRQRGRIVLTGVVGLNLKRADFYKKELTFQVSCSYGPGRYDPAYEEGNRDYPYGFVRWTEQRNFEAILELMAADQLDTRPLVSSSFAVEDAEAAYERLLAGADIGIMLTYPGVDADQERLRPTTGVVKHRGPESVQADITVGVIGAGDFAQLRILPILWKAGVRLKSIVSTGGLRGSIAAERFGFELSGRDAGLVIDDPEINTVVIATRHDTHAELSLAALRASKHVYVEKPLCISRSQLDVFVKDYQALSQSVAARAVVVGYNRRFASLSRRLAREVRGRTGPLAMTYTCNAGNIPPEHWVLDPGVGGGRIVGEACHFIDLLSWLAEAPVETVCATRSAAGSGEASVSVGLVFADGSVGNINYFVDGAKRFPKERLEVFCEGRVLQLDNYRKLRVYTKARTRTVRSWRQDKGHKQAYLEFLGAARGHTESPMSVDSAINVTEASIAVGESLELRQTISLNGSSL